MRKRRFVALLLAGIFLVSMGGTFLFTGGAPGSDVESQKKKLHVVASFYPMYIATMNLLDGVENVTLQNLSEPQTGCLHDYELTPGDMKLLDGADVLVVNGGGLEPFLEDVRSLDRDILIVDAGEALAEAQEDTEVHEEHDDHEDHDEHEHHHHGEVNAHFWMSPALYRQQVHSIAEGLKGKLWDEAQIAQLEANEADYDKTLESLAAREETLSASCRGRGVILFHEAYEYVARDLEMEEAFLLDLDEERQVSAKEIRSVVDAVRAGSDLILAEEQYGKKAAEAVTREVEAKVVYLDTITRGGEDGQTYAKDAYEIRMGENLKKLEEAI